MSLSVLEIKVGERQRKLFTSYLNFQEEKLFLESRLLLATQPPVCLEPSTDVVCVTNRLQYNRRKFHTPSMRRCVCVCVGMCVCV